MFGCMEVVGRPDEKQFNCIQSEPTSVVTNSIRATTRRLFASHFIWHNILISHQQKYNKRSIVITFSLARASHKLTLPGRLTNTLTGTRNRCKHKRCTSIIPFHDLKKWTRTNEGLHTMMRWECGHIVIMRLGAVHLLEKDWLIPCRAWIRNICHCRSLMELLATEVNSGKLFYKLNGLSALNTVFAWLASTPLRTEWGDFIGTI